MNQTDPYAVVMRPRNGSKEAIEKMNARMICFHPALHAERKNNRTLLHACHAVIQHNFSVAELFRRIGQNSDK